MMTLRHIDFPLTITYQAEARPDRPLPSWLKNPVKFKMTLPGDIAYALFGQSHEVAQSHLAFLEQYYKVQPNPLFIVKAEALCDQYNLDPPQWVVDYRKRTRDALMARSPPDGKSGAKTLEKAMEFDGTRTAWTRYHDLLQRIAMADTVEKFRAKGAKTPTVFEDVGELFNVSKSTVERAYNELRNSPALQPITLHFSSETLELSGKTSLLRFIYVWLQEAERLVAKRYNESPYLS